MKKNLVALFLSALLVPAYALGQVNLSITLPLPPVPPLVVVSPGVQVVENFQDEVFFHSGFYWARRDDRWYRAATPHASFAPVEVKVVPAELVKIPPGHYKHWKKAKAEHKAEEKAERKADKAEEKAEKHHGKHKK